MTDKPSPPWDRWPYRNLAHLVSPADRKPDAELGIGIPLRTDISMDEMEDAILKALGIDPTKPPSGQ